VETCSCSILEVMSHPMAAQIILGLNTQIKESKKGILARIVKA